jgi:hypothetical protein
MSVYAINCPSCGGTLEVLGGGRQISSLTCKYCGSVLDTENEYKVLAKFAKVTLPKSPFRLGMQGVIQGVAFTIIGMVAFSCVKGRSVGEDTWLDFMLFSPTHGYAWLSYEEGNTIFSRRTRDLPSRDMAKLSPKDKFTFQNQNYQFYEAYRAYVTYVQGELTWIARRDDMIRIYEAIRPPFGVALEKNFNESEYSISEYLDAAEVYKSFGITASPEEKFHPLKPFLAPKTKAFSKASALFAGVALLMVIILSIFHDGKLIAEDAFNALSRTIAFHIDNPEHLVELDIESNVDNNWIYFDISVLDADDEEVYALGEEISYYHGYEGGESWSEGSRSATAFFKVERAGDYRLEFSAPENSYSFYTHVTIRENVVRSLYFVILLVIFGLGTLIYLVKYASYYSKLWKHTQEDDDD